MDVDADVAFRGHGRRTGVDAHPNAHRALRKSDLRGVRGGDRVARVRERDEEGVALGVHLHAITGRHRATERAPMVCEHLDVAFAELMEESRRAFDVGEQQRDGA